MYGSFANLDVSQQGRELSKIRDPVIFAAHLRVVKVLQTAREVNFRIPRFHGQIADVDVPAGQNERRIRPPYKGGVVAETRVDAPSRQVGLVLPSQQRVGQLQAKIAGSKIKRHFLVLPQQFAILHFNARNCQRKEFLERTFAGGKTRLRHRRVARSIRIINDVNHGMVEFQFMQPDRLTEDGDNLHLRLHTIHMQERSLIGAFVTVNGQVARVHAKAKRDGVQLPEFDTPAGDFFRRGDYPPADEALKGFSRDVPAEQSEGDQRENTKSQEELPQDAPPLGWRRLGRYFERWFHGGVARRLTQGFRSPALDSGVGMWLAVRRLASHPVSNSFIFFSASRSLMCPKTSVKGAVWLPAFLISGSN